MLLEMRNVSSYYGSFLVLDNLSFTVDAGETVGLLGLPGSGKTTLMRLLSGFSIPNQGQVLLMGQSPSLPEGRRHFGYLPQGNSLPKDMRVREYLYFRARLHGMGRSAARKAAAAAADYCGVQVNYDTLIGRLSRISRRRVGLADASLAKPILLLLDEPTAGLEPEQAMEVRALIASLAADSALFMASSFPQDVGELCRRVMALQLGRLLADGATAAICEANIEDRTLSIELVADAPVKEALRIIPGVKAIQVVPGAGQALLVRLSTPAGVDLRREVMELCTRRGWLVSEMRLEPVKIDDIFRKLTRTG